MGANVQKKCWLWHLNMGGCMDKHLALIIVFFVMVTASSIMNARADEDCLNQVSERIKPNTEVNVFPPEGKKLIGYLVAVDLQKSTLALRMKKELSGPLKLITLSEIKRVEYHGSKAMRLEITLPLIVAGGVIGGALGDTFDEAKKDIHDNGTF